MKIASLIDFPKPTLDSNVWDLNRNILNPVCKDFIVRILNTFIESRNLKASEQWITDITLVGSICTYLWNSQSDIDVHVKVDINKFKETNVPEMTEEKAAEYLDQLRKELDVAKLLLPLSNGHVVEYYFETKFHPANISRVGVYSIFMNKWLKTPPPVPQDFDIEKIKPRIVEEATEIALSLDENFSRIRQNLVRIEDLIETLKTWPKEKQQLYVDKINDKISKIEMEIKEALQVKEDLVTERHKKQDPLSDNELIFKWLQHMSYFSILSNLKTLLEHTGGEISTTELPLIDKIISQGSLGSAGQYWFDPSGKFYKVDLPAHNHTEWIQQNTGIDNIDHALEKGWIRARKDGDTASIDLGSLLSIPDFINDFILELNADTTFIEDIQNNYVKLSREDVVELGPAKAITKALQEKRMALSSIKEAFLKEAFEKETLLIDFDRTLAVEHDKGVIGEPINGAKEALDKLKQQGFDIEIYSVRANDEKGLDEVKEWLDKNNIAYDSIFQGEKPRGTIIDDHAIRFDNNWDEIVKQVEKSDKKASIRITSAIQLQTIDPKTFKRKEPYALFIGTQMFSKTEGIDLFDVFGEHPMINEHNQMPTVNMDVLIKNNIPVIGKEPRAGNKQPFQDISKIVKQAQTKKIKQGKYGCLMALVPHELAQEIVAWGVVNIPDSVLYIDEDAFGRELEVHCTIKYGLVSDDAKTARRLFNNHKPFKATLGKVKHFEPDVEWGEFDVVTVAIESKDLEQMNKEVCEKLECAEGLVSDDYKPHLTIAYVKKGRGKDFIGSTLFEGKEIELDTVVFSPAVGNKTYFSVSQDKESQFVLEKIDKKASGDNFLPSLFNAPNNDWQFQEGDSDQEIALNPDSVSDDITEYEPCTTGKPRTKEVWRQFISMFTTPFSKKEDVQIEAVYDKELEEAEKNALGEDQTLLEYSKGFYDPKDHDFPHNTTWDSLTQDGEPSKPTSVTYSPQISNEDNLDQNSPGGYPRRFMGKPKGEWFSNEGEVNNALIDMLKNREAALDSMTRDITADYNHAYWIDPSGKIFEVRGSTGNNVGSEGNKYGPTNTHSRWILDNLDMLEKNYGIDPKNFSGTSGSLIDLGWIRVGDAYGTDWGVTVKSLNNIPSSVDDLLAQFAPEGSKITVETPGAYKDSITFEWPVNSIQKTVQQYRNRRPAMAKKAAVDFDNEYPIAGGNVDGRTVLDGVPNQSSIEASLTDYDILPGIREVSFSSFTQMPNLSYYSVDEEKRTKQLAEQIQQSNEITPLIVAIDNQGPYILEGGHRFDALRELGANSFPAMVVLDNESLNRMAKKASIEEIDGLPVLVNPTENELKGFSRNLKGGHMFRGLIDPHTGDLFVWDAYEAIHTYVIQKLGLDVKYSDESPFCLYFPPSDIYDALARQQEVKRGDKLRSTGSLDKKAGSYSSTYTDEQGEQFFNEQHQNDVDQVPYTNFDQRSAPNAFHDSPENTAFNIGWAKDNQPYVVRLDQLDNPAYRDNPFNMTEYWVTYYNSMPMSDGIEQMNPD